MSVKPHDFCAKVADHSANSHDFCGAFVFHNLLDIQDLYRSVSAPNRAVSFEYRAISSGFRAVSLDYRAISACIVRNRRVARLENGEGYPYDGLKVE